MHLIVPIMVDVYAASIIATVIIKTLTGLLKAISYSEGDEIKRVLIVSAGSSTPGSYLTLPSQNMLPDFLCPTCHLRTIQPNLSVPDLPSPPIPVSPMINHGL
jgi:hypothetical protein